MSWKPKSTAGWHSHHRDSRRQVPSRWQLATPLGSPSASGGLRVFSTFAQPLRCRPGRPSRGPGAATAATTDRNMGRKASPGAQERVDEEARTCCGCRFPLLLALLQLALGIAVTVLGFLMASISPSLLVRDTPFWAGIIVSIESVLPKRQRACQAAWRSED